MSFDIYVQCFEGGEPAGMPLAAIRPLFPLVEADSDARRWTVRYDRLNSCDVYLTAQTPSSDDVTALCMSRPCGHPELWRALFRLLQLGQVVLYFPGGD